MKYIDEKIQEIKDLLKEEPSLTKSASDEELKYGKELLQLADALSKYASQQDITVDDLRKFIKGEITMDKHASDVFIKAASILRAVAKYIDKEQMAKEAKAKEILNDKLRTLGVEVEPEKVEKIAQHKEVIDILSKIPESLNISVGEVEKAADIGKAANADDRFVNWILS